MTTEYPPLEPYPPLLGEVMGYVIPGQDLPLDWFMAVGAAHLLDPVFVLFGSIKLFLLLPLFWAVPLFVAALIGDRVGKAALAFGLFGAGWGGAMLLAIFVRHYVMSVTTLYTVVAPALVPVFVFLSLASAVKLIDLGAPAWMGWLPRLVLSRLNGMGVLPAILMPAQFAAPVEGN